MTTFGIYWDTSSNGNPIVKDGYDDVLCTLFRNEYGAWRVVVNLNTPTGPKSHFSSKLFATLDEASEHAEQLITIRAELEPTPECEPDRIGEWRTQSRKSNGAPTYGRPFGRKHASVKLARSGKWFYVVSVGPNTRDPVGWFDSAESAMAACDAAFGLP